MNDGGEPSDEDRRWLEEMVLRDTALDGGGFIMEGRSWAIWLMTVEPDVEEGRPQVLRGYPVRYRKGPIRWMRDSQGEA